MLRECLSILRCTYVACLAATVEYINVLATTHVWILTAGYCMHSCVCRRARSELGGTP